MSPTEAWDLGRYRDKGNEKELESLGLSRAGWSGAQRAIVTGESGAGHGRNEGCSHMGGRGKGGLAGNSAQES